MNYEPTRVRFKDFLETGWKQANNLEKDHIHILVFFTFLTFFVPQEVQMSFKCEIKYHTNIINCSGFCQINSFIEYFPK